MPQYYSLFVTVHGKLWSTRRENTAFQIADIVVGGYEHIPGYKFSNRSHPGHHTRPQLAQL